MIVYYQIYTFSIRKLKTVYHLNDGIYITLNIFRKNKELNEYQITFFAFWQLNKLVLNSINFIVWLHFDSFKLILIEKKNHWFCVIFYSSVEKLKPPLFVSCSWSNCSNDSQFLKFSTSETPNLFPSGCLDW